MEAISMHHSYIADAHGYANEDGQAHFLRHNPNQTDSPQIEFVSRDRKIHSYSRHDSLDVPPAFFCSIYDIQTLESHETNDLTKYILNQIGCGQVHKLYEQLRILHEIEIISLLVGYSSISGKGKSLSSVEQQKRKKRREEIKDLIPERLGIPKTSLSQIYDYKWNQTDLLRFKEVYDYLRVTLDEDLRKIEFIAKGIVPLIMTGFLEKDCSLEVTYENLSFRIDLKVGPDSTKDTPRRYFNTFRFKLFVVALKTSLACSVKIIHRINFPMVLDDVFDASDFKHKHDIREFIRNIMKSHDQALSKSRINDSPMQLLFMSQDDMIAISAYQGVCDADIEKTDKRTLVKFCRLYPHKEIDTKADLMEVTTSDSNVCYHKIFNTIESNF